MADGIGAAAAGLGRHQGGELVGGGEAGQVAGRVRITHRSAVVVDAGLGEQGGEFDLAGAGAPVGRLAGAPGDRGAHHRHAGAVDGDVELVRRGAAVSGCGQHAHRAARDGVRLGGQACRGGGAVGLGGTFDPLGGQPDSGQVGEQVGGGGERFGGGGARGDAAQSRRQRRAGDAELVVAGRDPVFTLGAVVPGAVHGDAARHGVEVCVSVSDEFGVMPLAAVDSRAAVPGVGGQQLAQQRGAQLGHRGADRQLHRLQARAGPQRGGSQRSEPVYLSGELRRDLRAEPPSSSPVGAAGGAVAAGLGGRASQICLVDRHDLLAHLGETVVVGQLGAHLVHLLGRQLPALGAAAGHGARPQIARPMAGVIRLRARTVRLAAATVVLADRAPPEVAGRGQLLIESRPSLLQILRRAVAHSSLLSGCYMHNQTTPRPAPTHLTYIRVAHPTEPADPLLLGRRVVAILETGLRTATYKLATLTALIDHCVENWPTNPADSLQVPIPALAHRVLEVYWQQVRPFDGHALRQSTQPQARILSATIALRDAAEIGRRGLSVDTARLQAPEAYQRAIDEITVCLAHQPLHRLQKLPGSSTRDVFLYEDPFLHDKVSRSTLRANGDSIVLKPVVAQGLARLAGLLKPALEIMWVDDVRRMNKFLDAEVPDVAGHLFGRERTALAVVRESFKEVFKPHCFYCGTHLPADNPIDHVLPWSLVGIDGLANLVLALRTVQRRQERCAVGGGDRRPRVGPRSGCARRTSHAVAVADSALAGARGCARDLSGPAGRGADLVGLPAQRTVGYQLSAVVGTAVSSASWLVCPETRPSATTTLRYPACSGSTGPAPTA